jgi:hypothetical protein
MQNIQNRLECKGVVAKKSKVKFIENSLNGNHEIYADVKSTRVRGKPSINIDQGDTIREEKSVNYQESEWDLSVNYLKQD